MSRILNITIQLLNLLAGGLFQFSDFIPDKYKLLTAIINFAIAGIVGIIASDFNPDGTPAVKPYTSGLPKKDYIAPRGLLILLLIPALLLNASCGGAKSKEIQLADIGKNINLGINQGVKALRTAHRGKLIQDAPYVFLLKKAKAIQTAADRANVALDAIAILDTTNKADVLRVLAEVTTAAQDALNDPAIALLSLDVQRDVNRILTGISISVQIAAALVSGIQQPTPINQIRFQFTEVF